MPAVLAVRALRGSYPLEVLHFLEELIEPIVIVEVTLSNQEDGSEQRRKWLIGRRDIRDLAAEVMRYIEERARLWGTADAIVVARPSEQRGTCKSAPEIFQVSGDDNEVVHWYGRYSAADNSAKKVRA
jgi:hypothetical protein